MTFCHNLRVGSANYHDDMGGSPFFNCDVHMTGDDSVCP